MGTHSHRHPWQAFLLDGFIKDFTPPIRGPGGQMNDAWDFIRQSMPVTLI